MRLRDRVGRLVPVALAALVVVSCTSEPPHPTTPASPAPSATRSQHAATSEPSATQEIGDAALDIAVGDGRLSMMLAAHPYTVDGIRSRSGHTVDLLLQFDDPVPMEAWPLDVCEIRPEGSPFTGVHFLIDLDARRVDAVSPLWDQSSCIIGL